MENFLFRVKVFSKLLDTEFSNEKIKSVTSNAIQDLTSAMSFAITELEKISVKLEKARLSEKYFLYHLSSNDEWYYDGWDDIQYLKENLKGIEYGELLFIECLLEARNYGTSIDDPTRILNRANEVLKIGFESSGVYELRSRAHFCMNNFGLSLLDIDQAIELSQNNLKKKVGYLLLKCRIYEKIGKLNDVSEILQEIVSLWNKISEDEFLLEWSLSHHIEDELFWRFGLDQKYGIISDAYKDQAKLIMCVLLANVSRIKYIEPLPDKVETYSGKQFIKSHFSPIYSSLVDLVGEEFWKMCGGKFSVQFVWD